MRTLYHSSIVTPSAQNDVEEVKGIVPQAKPQRNNSLKHLSPCYQGFSTLQVNFFP